MAVPGGGGGDDGFSSSGNTLNLFTLGFGPLSPICGSSTAIGFDGIERFFLCIS